MIIYSLRFPIDEPLSFYAIVKDIVELTNNNVSEEQIEIGLTQFQHEALMPILELMRKDSIVIDTNMNKLGDIPIRIIDN